MLVPLWAKIESGQKRWWQFVGAEQMQMPSPDTDAKSTRVTLFKKKKERKKNPDRHDCNRSSQKKEVGFRR